MKKLIPFILLALSFNLVSCHHDENPTTGHEFLLSVLFGETAPLGHQIVLRPYASVSTTRDGLKTAPNNMNVILYQNGKITVNNERYIVDTSGYNPEVMTYENAQAYLDQNRRAIQWQGGGNVVTVGNNSFNTYKDPVTGMWYMEGESSSVKDLERMGANMEAVETDELRERLAAEFGLSETRATEIARISSNLKKIGNKRSLTPRELNKASKELLGIDYHEGMTAINEGGETLDNLLKVAAKKNGTSPEAVQEILQDYLLR
jgi:hypothetical protein